MKYLLLVIISFLSSHALADDSYFCLSDGGKSVLLVPKNYSNINTVLYYPYLKPIKISKVTKTRYGDTGGEKPEVFNTMNEIINGKVTGKYVFNIQGYIINYVDYINLKTKKKTTFLLKNGEDFRLKDIDCLSF